MCHPDKEYELNEDGEQEEKNKEAEVAGEDDKGEKEPLEKEKDLYEHIRELEEALSVEQEEKENLFNRLRRAHADFANYKKRMERARFKDKQNAQEEIIQELLPVLDNLERALHIDETPEKETGVFKGVEMTFRQFKEMLAEKGLEEIKGEGEVFDPQQHEILEQIESEEVPQDVIMEVFRKGYRIGDKVIRPSLVKVSKGGEEKDE